MRERITVVEEKVKDIPIMHEKIDKIGDQLKDISEYMVRTDNKIEVNQKEIDGISKRSFGVWCGKHPIQFSIYFVVSIITLITMIYTRDSILQLIQKYLGG